jgi:hypothetical protein
MRLLTCAGVRRRLAAYHDGEMSLEGQIAVRAHLAECVGCAAEVVRLQALGDVLRAGSSCRVNSASDSMAGLQASVLSRMKAEHDESWPSCVHRMFEDMHLVWAALGATAATIACAAITLGILYFGPGAERPDSLSAVIAGLVPGSNSNPVTVDAGMILPRAKLDGIVSTVDMNGEPDYAVFALSAVVTREGRVANLELIQSEQSGGRLHDEQAVLDLLDAVSKARFEPARSGGSPVAVNMVWLLAHTTVRGKSQTFDGGRNRGRIITQDLSRFRGALA